MGDKRMNVVRWSFVARLVLTGDAKEGRKMKLDLFAKSRFFPPLPLGEGRVSNAFCRRSKIRKAFKKSGEMVFMAAACVCVGAFSAEDEIGRECPDEKPSEETLYGILEKTAHENACAQIADALGDVYYIMRTPEAVESCKAWYGKTVVLIGIVERQVNSTILLFRLKTVQAWTPKPPPKRNP